jgi:ferredoxin
VLDAYKICNDCGECNYCDLDKNKLCDNCGKCLDASDFNGVIIDKIILPKT